jgi:hypothetical protein
MDKMIRIVRVETTSDNRRFVGLLVPNEAVETVLEGFFLFLYILLPFLKSNCTRTCFYGLIS